MIEDRFEDTVNGLGTRCAGTIVCHSNTFQQCNDIHGDLSFTHLIIVHRLLPFQFIKTAKGKNCVKWLEIEKFSWHCRVDKSTVKNHLLFCDWYQNFAQILLLHFFLSNACSGHNKAFDQFWILHWKIFQLNNLLEWFRIKNGWTPVKVISMRLIKMFPNQNGFRL